MTLYEQIKDSYDKSYEYIGEEPEFDSGWRAAISYILEDIISKHDCIPDRDELARVLHQTQIIGCIASDGWGRDCDGQCRDEADAIIVALEKP